MFRDRLPFGQIKKDDEITIWSQFLKFENKLQMVMKKIGRKNCYTEQVTFIGSCILKKPEGQELSSWQQNRMGDSIKHKVCTGLGAQHFLLG
ncbi:hypothetical protein ACJIZ3_019900 [Penstemon smallii]|uniref:Uncharacterized protein n=1 Tax=Penstemon smallii TaxID=265156 RepID=A0ABD3T373_9LAMI